MRKLLLLCLAITGSSQLFAQDDKAIEALMTRRLPDCREIVYNATVLLPQYHQEGKLDTFNAMISYWERHCGRNELTVAFRMLSGIEQGKFADEALEYNMLYYMRQYMNRDKGRTQWDWGTNYIDQAVYTYITKWAERLNNITDLTNTERFIVRFYSDPTDEKLKELDNERFAGTGLQQQWKEMSKEMDPNRGMHLALLAGGWTPMGKASLLGSHPYIGMQLGGGTRKLMVNFDMSFRFITSPNEYYTVHEGETKKTGQYFGAFMGLTGSYELLALQHHSFFAQAGIAYDGFDAVTVKYNDEDDNRKSKTISSFNAHIGLGDRYYYKPGSYLGLEVKYHKLSYSNPGGTDLAGDAFTIGLIWGGFVNGASNWPCAYTKW